ncbi:uncharacterized protein LOC144359893 [Saccoglossus kowalevskii]
MVNEVDRLEEMLTKHEKKCRISERWSITSDIYTTMLSSAKRKTQNNIFSQISILSKERKYLLTLVKKYADGQRVAIRLSKKIKKANQKLQSLVIKYNLVRGERDELTLEQVKDTESPLWNVGSSEQVPAATKQELVTDYLKCQRAKEEVILCQEEMKRVVHFFHDQRRILWHWLIEIRETVESGYDMGCIALVTNKYNCMGRTVASLTEMFSPFVDLNIDIVSELTQHEPVYHLEEVVEESDPLYGDLSLYLDQELVTESDIEECESSDTSSDSDSDAQYELLVA